MSYEDRINGTLLVTGAAGFIGMNFVQHWVTHYPQSRLILVDALFHQSSVGRLAAIPDRIPVTFMRADICDETLMHEIMVKEQVRCIVNFAAESHVDESIREPDKFLQANVVGTHSLLKACLRYWRQSRNIHFHQISTDEVYGSLDSTNAPFSECSAYAPSSPYSASKAASDHFVTAYFRTYGLPVTRTNCSNNYGPYQSPNKLIPLVIASALSGDRIPLYGSGENIRDWLYVQDHCRAIATVLEHGVVGEAYNVGGDCELRNNEVVDEICLRLNKRFETRSELRALFPRSPAARGERLQELIKYVEDRPGHDYRYALNTNKVRSLNFRPSWTFRQGIESTIDWYLAHETWWRSDLG